MPFTAQEPFTFADGLAAGWTRQELRACTRLSYGVLLDPAVPVTPILRAKGALLGLPDSAYASHATAARVLGLPVPDLPFEHVTVADERDRRRRAERICHVRANGVVWRSQGINLSSPAQIWAELSSQLSVLDRVVLGDAILKRSWQLDPAEPDAAARLVRPGVASPMETKVRMLIHWAGLPEPEVDHVVRDEQGEPRRQDDLYYRASRTVIQYDGRHHIEREQRWHRDLVRREEAESLGLRFVVVTSPDVHRTPGATVERIWRVLIERGEPKLPRVLRREWELHFPQRGDRPYGRG